MTYPLDPISLTRLALVCPALKTKVLAAMTELSAHGTYIRVTQGLRSYVEQDQLYAQGRSTPGHIVTNARGGFSNHNFGMAVDCIPFLQGSQGELNWNAQTQQFQVMVAALKSQELAWGGDWHSITDYPHFQIASAPVTPTGQDRTDYAAGGLSKVWARYGVAE